MNRQEKGLLREELYRLDKLETCSTPKEALKITTTIYEGVETVIYQLRYSLSMQSKFNGEMMTDLNDLCDVMEELNTLISRLKRTKKYNYKRLVDVVERISCLMLTVISE